MKTVFPINGAMCQDCGDVIWSRHVHDMRSCACGEIAIDGGREYTKMSFKGKLPIMVKIEKEEKE